MNTTGLRFNNIHFCSGPGGPATLGILSLKWHEPKSKANSCHQIWKAQAISWLSHGLQVPRSPQFKNANSTESRVETEMSQKAKLTPFMSVVFNLLDEAVSAIPVCRHLPSIGWYLVQAPGSRGRWPAWRLRPVAGGKKKKSLHQTPGNFFSDKFQRGHRTCSSQLWAVYSGDYMND